LAEVIITRAMEESSVTAPYICQPLLQAWRSACKAYDTVGWSSWNDAQRTRWPHHIRQTATAWVMSL